VYEICVETLCAISEGCTTSTNTMQRTTDGIDGVITVLGIDQGSAISFVLPSYMQAWVVHERAATCAMNSTDNGW
jgi:hypothetical protein